MGKKHYAVMLVDDREVDNVINTDKLEKADFADVIYKNNSGESALEFLKNMALISTAENNKLPEYIFIDLDMPVMDGIQFLEEYDKLDSLVKDSCKVVMLSATQNNADIEEASNNKNLFRFFKKPLTLEYLAELP